MIYILTIIDFYGKVLHQEVFGEVPTMGPDEVSYDPSRYHIEVRAANIDGGDSREMRWNQREKEWS
jgi:hypothetical protein